MSNRREIKNVILFNLIERKSFISSITLCRNHRVTKTVAFSIIVLYIGIINSTLTKNTIDESFGRAKM